MAVVHVTEFELDGDEGGALAHYDAVASRVAVAQDPPVGLIVHVVGFLEGRLLRIVDVWESEEHSVAFAEGRLAAVLEALEPELAAPSGQRSYTYVCHNVVTGRG